MIAPRGKRFDIGSVDAWCKRQEIERLGETAKLQMIAQIDFLKALYPSKMVWSNAQTASDGMPQEYVAKQWDGCTNS